jgi:hypothetical protein
LDLNNPPTAVGGIQKLNVIASRLDLNNPPTAVGGISEFSPTRYRAIMMTSSGRDKRDAAGRGL